MRFLGLILALLALLAAPALAAQDLPARPDGPVLDQAGILPPADEAALDSKLREYNRTTGRSVIVATVPDLGGEPVDTFTRDLAEAWDIGGAETEEGVLMVIAPKERKVWISTARGVQVRLTDVAAGRIVRNVIIPAFKSGDMPGGIAAGADAIIERLNMDPAQAAAIDEAESAAGAQRRGDGASIGGVIFWIVMIVAFMLIFGRGGGRRRRRYGVGSAIGDVILWNAVGHALGHRDHSGHSGIFGGGGSGGGGFGGFGGGGGGFNGGGAGGSW